MAQSSVHEHRDTRPIKTKYFTRLSPRIGSYWDNNKNLQIQSFKLTHIKCGVHTYSVCVDGNLDVSVCGSRSKCKELLSKYKKAHCCLWEAQFVGPDVHRVCHEPRGKHRYLWAQFRLRRLKSPISIFFCSRPFRFFISFPVSVLSFFKNGSHTGFT